jgi:amino acid permease
MGIVVNCGGNADGEYIGGKNWHIPGAPFVGGIGGFASVFVTASFACKCPKKITLQLKIVYIQLTAILQTVVPNPLPSRPERPRTPRKPCPKW